MGKILDNITWIITLKVIYYKFVVFNIQECYKMFNFQIVIIK